MDKPAQGTHSERLSERCPDERARASVVGPADSTGLFMIGRLPRTENAKVVTTRVTITVVGGAPTAVFRRVPDLRNTLAADDDMGLPLTNPHSVAAKIIGRLYTGVAADGGEP